jgi:magnesium transporter
VTETLSGLDGAARERVALLREQGSFFWLDVSLGETSRDDLVDALQIPGHVIPTLALSGDPSPSRSFHADGESVVFAIRGYVGTPVPTDDSAYGLRPVDVRVLVTGDYLLTLHEERVSLPTLLALDLPEERSKQYVVYAVLEGLLETTSDALVEIELRLDAIGVAWAGESGGRVPSRARLRETGPRLSTMRRAVSAEQAVFARIGVEIGALRGFETHGEPYFDRLYEQVDRLLASIDAAVNTMGMLLDLQLNERAYVVSVLATIFLPLTLITGFFGMNFGWMVDQIDTPIAFWLLGFLGLIAVAVLCWRLLVRRFLMGD